EVLAQTAVLPGVTGVGDVEWLPVTRARRSGSVVAVNGRTAESIMTEPRVISAGYLETMDIGVVLGRSFNRSDVSGSIQVAIVSEGLARRLWSGSNPLGHHIRYEKEEQREVVGVVQAVRSYAVDTTPGPEIYIPYSQTWLIPQQLVVRTDSNPTP